MAGAGLSPIFILDAPLDNAGRLFARARWFGKLNQMPGRGEMNMSTLEATNHQRRMILLAIEKAIPATARQNGPCGAPRYPDGVPEIGRHVDDLVRLIREVGHPGQSPAARIRGGICDQCPHQFPERYCPLRQSGGCVPYRFAEQIAEAVSSALRDDR
jgi:hypothetical protein